MSKNIFNSDEMFIIIEAGVNHNGDIIIAKKLVDAAKYAGVDAVKFQTFKAELIVAESADQALYQKNNTKEESQFSMLKRLELTEDDFSELKSYCDNKEILFLSTPHSDKWSVDLLEKLGMSYYKIGSGDLTNLPILSYIARLNKPIILSTGMGTIEEIKDAVICIKNEGNNKISLLHCTTNYPCPSSDANLRAIQTLRDNFKDLSIGYSDHTTNMETSVIATCLGCDVYEKHFTLDKTMKGPDHMASFEPDEVKKMTKAIRFIEKNGISDPYVAFDRLNNEFGYTLNKDLIEVLLGSSVIKPTPEELEIAKVARKSIVALENISPDEKLTEENVGIRRPGEGLSPKFFDEVLGKRSKVLIKKNDYVKLEMLY